jgi:outer membrane protein OmpA-like peptidoglycan-associated protein
VIGIGAAGACAFAYFNGKLTKTYESEYHDTVRASSATLEDLKIPITETIADALKTEIKAKRTDGAPVVIEILRIEKDLTQVSVRTGSLGVWDKRVSEQIHRYINQNLNHRSIADLSGHEQVEAPSKSAEMLVDSIFVIFFKQNSNDLSERAVEKLDQVFEIFIKNPSSEIILNGYSDSMGVASYNEMVSEIRANAVKSYLIGKGIEPFRMTAFGHGSQKFIASNKSAEGRQLNRRVEIELISP